MPIRITDVFLQLIPYEIRERFLNSLFAQIESLISEFHRYRQTVILDEGVLLRMDRGLSNKMVSLLRKGRHAWAERKLVIPALEENDVVMELGAGIGHLAIRCAKKIGSDRVSTFEANPHLRQLVYENFRLNSVSPRAEFCLLGKAEGTAEFHVGKHFWSSSTMRAPYHDRTIRVPVKPFNKMIKELNPTFVIIDIEGGEYELFQYADLRTVTKLMVEAHPKILGAEKVERMLRRINDLGLGLREKRGDCYLFYRTSDSARSDDFVPAENALATQNVLG